MERLLLITPPFTQVNCPYPATAYLKGYLNGRFPGRSVRPVDRTDRRDLHERIPATAFRSLSRQRGRKYSADLPDAGALHGDRGRRNGFSAGERTARWPPGSVPESICRKPPGLGPSRPRRLFRNARHDRMRPGFFVRFTCRISATSSARRLPEILRSSVTANGFRWQSNRSRNWRPNWRFRRIRSKNG